MFKLFPLNIISLSFFIYWLWKPASALPAHSCWCFCERTLKTEVPSGSGWVLSPCLLGECREKVMRRNWTLSAGRKSPPLGPAAFKPRMYMLVKSLKQQTWIELLWNGFGVVLLNCAIDEKMPSGSQGCLRTEGAWFWEDPSQPGVYMVLFIIWCLHSKAQVKSGVWISASKRC